MNRLRPQLEAYNGNVIAVINKDNREKTIGEKRNELIDFAVTVGAKYRAFIDDDDMVSENYIEINMAGANKDVDCNSLIGIYSENGFINPNKHIFIHSIEYKEASEDAKYYYRFPNHLNWTKLDKVKDLRYDLKNDGEDMAHAEIIAREGRLKTEYEVGEPIYYYQFRSKPDGI